MMSDLQSQQQHLDDLRARRGRHDPDWSMQFLDRYFKTQIQKPFKQLNGLGQIWADQLPPELLEHTRLDRFTRGVLTVAVDSSAHLYELDRILRSGLQNQIISSFTAGSLRKIRLTLAR